MKGRVFLGLACLLGAIAPIQAQVVINEFIPDDMSGDSLEFIELYNAGATAVDISGYAVRRGNTAVNATATIPASTTLPAQGLYVISTAASAGLGLGPAGITPDLTGQMTNLANSMHFIALHDASNTVIDSLVYGRAFQNVNILAGMGEPAFNGSDATSGGGIWAYNLASESANTDGSGMLISGSPNATLTYQRYPGAVDTNDNERDFHLAVVTPKTLNFSNATITPAQVNAGITMDFELADGTAETRFPGQFASLTCQDPAVVDATVTGNPNTANNPSVIPAAPAPGGGNVGMCWATVNTTNTGYGNCAILNLTQPMSDVEMESLVYIGPVLTGTQWEVGTYMLVRGRPDPVNFYGTDTSGSPQAPNGDVGVRIRFENNWSSSGQVQLFVDEKFKGVAANFGGPITITNPGWYRLLLSVKGTQVVAIIGGTYGNYTTDGNIAGAGLKISGTTTITSPGGVGMNYKTKIPVTASGESINNVRPLTYDHLTVRAPIVASVSGWELY